jgi:hypothetical protein
VAGLPVCFGINAFGEIAAIKIALSHSKLFNNFKYQIMKRIMVRYKVKADRAEENKQLIKTVFEELAAKQPGGIRYAGFVLPDGVSFVHIASIETADGKNPLNMTASFPLFSKDIKDRCEELPVVVDLSEIGAYNLF